MKKLLSILLAVTMLFTIMSPAFACVGNDDTQEPPTTVYPQPEEHDDDCTVDPVVIVKGMDFGGLKIDAGTEDERPAFNLDVGELLKALAGAIAAGIIHRDIDAFFDKVIDYAADLFDGMAMNKDGTSKYNVSIAQYPHATENYPVIWEEGDSKNESGMARTGAEYLPKNHTYLFTYDWRLDPYDVADDIAVMIDRAIAESGHDKVTIVCSSMGGIMTVGYLSKYGYSKVSRCVFMSSTICGAQVASDALCGKVEITQENLYNFFSVLLADSTGDNAVVSALMKALYSFGGFKVVEKLGTFILDNYQEEVFDRVLRPCFAYMPVLWGLVQPEDYDDAVEYIFKGNTEDNAAILARADKLQKMMADRNALISDMVDDGVELAIVSHYGRPVIPVYENADFTGDGVLETYETSGYATVAKYGETLGDDYVAVNEKYLSPDRCVDLSTAIFPEYTYMIKGAPHVACTYGTDYSYFFLWLVSYDGDDFYAGVSEDYPQFMLSAADQHLSKWN